MKKLALCFHDVRLSQAQDIVESVRGLRRRFDIEAITCHVVADAEVEEENEALRFLQQEAKAGKLEVVFHGVAHRCPLGTAGLWAWYHHDEAEFLGSAFNAPLNRQRYHALAKIFGPMGICPPCWVAGKTGWAFLESLQPEHLEKMLGLRRGGRFFFSPVISLGSAKRTDLFFLKAMARLVGACSGLLRWRRVRLVVHPVDLRERGSMEFFLERVRRLSTRGYQPVLQKNLAGN